jgi:hypothetical protein
VLALLSVGNVYAAELAGAEQGQLDVKVSSASPTATDAKLDGDRRDDPQYDSRLVPLIVASLMVVILLALALLALKIRSTPKRSVRVHWLIAYDRDRQ